MSSVQSIMDELWDFDDPAESESRFRAALARAENESLQLELRTQIARALGLQRRYDEAHATLGELEHELSDHADDSAFAAARVRIALERGRLLNSSHRPEAARPHFDVAWQLARASNLDALAVDAAHMIAIVTAPDDSLEWNQCALALAESSTDHRARRWRGSLHNNLGWTFHDRGDFESALEQFQAACECRLEGGRADQIRIARWCIARCLRSLGRVEEALDIQESLYAAMAADGNPDGFIFEELAECLEALERREKARPHFARAYELLSRDPWLAEREPARLQRLASLAGVTIAESE